MSQFTHRSHCCVVHGCKYGEDTCPVCAGYVSQQYLCEHCYNDLSPGRADKINYIDVKAIEILWDKIHKKSLKENRRLKLAKIKSNV